MARATEIAERTDPVTATQIMAEMEADTTTVTPVETTEQESPATTRAEIHHSLETTVAASIEMTIPPVASGLRNNYDKTRG